MRQQRHSVSVAPLLGMALSALPSAVTEPLLGMAAGAIVRRHPGLFGRFRNELGFLIDPVDLPLCLVVRLGRTHPALTLIRRDAFPRVDATIRAPLAVLIDLLEGRADGDAAFFSRDLVIEGDTEAVLTLRNAIDGAEIRVIEDVASLLGPLAGIAGHACREGLALIEGAAARAERMLRAIGIQGRFGP
jgi:predicted lipid carrier protein YhbT